MGLIAQALAPVAVALAGAALILLRPWRFWLLLTEAAILVSLVALAGPASESPIGVSLYTLLPGIALQFRIDALGLLLAGAPALVGLLAALPEAATPFGLTSRARAWVLVAQAGLCLAVLAAGLATMAAAWAGTVVALTFSMALTRGARVPAGTVRVFAIAGGASALLTSAGAAAVQAAAGTTSFSAVPPDSVTVGATILLVTMPVLALLGGGIVLRASRSAVQSSVAWAILLAAGAGALLRLYDVGDGQLSIPAVRLALLVLGGGLALVLAVSAWWAPDLGAAAARILQSGAALVLAAAGAGGALGPLAALALALESMLVALALLSLVEAGGGRLPASRLLAPLGFVVLLAAAGLPIGPGLVSRAALVRAVVELGLPAALLAIPAVLALPAQLLGLLLAARFGGAEARETAGRARLALSALALLAAAAAAAGVAHRLVAVLAGTQNLPAAELQHDLDIAIVPAPLALGGGLVLLALTGAWVALRTARGRPPWPRSPSLLPPRLAFAPRLAVARTAYLARSAAAALRAREALAGRGVLAAAWLLGLGAAVAVFLR